MGEVWKVVSGEGIHMTTYFDPTDFFAMLKAWFKRNNYRYKEQFHNEYVQKDGRTIEYSIKPAKKISEYVKLEIDFYVTLKNVKDVEVEKDGHKIKIMQGDIDINIDAFKNNDYEGKWDGRALYFFFRVIADKFIFSGRDSESSKQLTDDVASLKREIKAYLNMKRYV